MRDVSHAFLFCLLFFFLSGPRDHLSLYAGNYVRAIANGRGTGTSFNRISRDLSRKLVANAPFPGTRAAAAQASTTMEKKRNRPGQRTTVASASGSFRLLSRSRRGCSRNASLGGRARCIRSNLQRYSRFNIGVPYTPCFDYRSMDTFLRYLNAL